MTIAGETFQNRSMELPDELVRGTSDVHVHSGPWLKSCPGRLDPFQIAEQAKAAGMRSLVFYDHTLGVSSGTALLTSRQVPGIEIFGGIILTTALGGLNPRAVKTALHYGAGAKFVHFGAHCTHFMASHEGSYVNGEPVPFKDQYPKFAEQELAKSIRIPLEGPVPDDLAEILQLIAERPDVHLNTGHVSVAEAFRLVDLAVEAGVRKIVVAHPCRGRMTTEQQKELASRGVLLEGAVSDWMFHRGLPRTNYYVEREWADEIAGIANSPEFSGVVPWARQIREIGIEHFVLGTDYGIRSGPTPLEGMRTLISTLLDLEFTPEEIHVLVKGNPEKLLGLEP
ncbi:DUF6282 family protein [Saccharopolyspora hirsuta]|uniref:Amidohydrolase family protein n=1 Tax=Saccharopolyspora hirsuta TaxID=1837 RepID=A0A5M7BC29_SACHI|nr:DUF6282 family protein [Saccharopolyspora hirsuta]KAA5827052.1 hypothetical protein F1721_29120 [Saccharopolyspora hirsuta]